MKKYNPPSKGMTAQDQQRLVMPVLASIVFFLLILTAYSALFIFSGELTEKILLGLSCLGIIASFILYYLVLPKTHLLDKFKWIIAVVIGLVLGLIAVFIPEPIFSIFFVLYLLSVITLAVINGREATFLMIAIVTILE